jgi:predicted nucleic acid-binding protein
VSLVLDASVVLALVLREERLHTATAILRQASRTITFEPGHWHLEVGNTLALAERRGSLTVAEVGTAIEFLGQLPVRVDVETPHRAWRDSLVLMRRHRLTLYDAAYLELALRTGASLATFDTALARAAETEGVAAGR